MRIRTVKPEFWTDEDVGELSMMARLAFIGSWNLADDEGLLKWTPAYIKAQLFAYDDTTQEEVANVLREIEERGLVFAYKDGKAKSYGWILNFRRHQRIDKPQPPKNPVPSIQNPKVRKAYAERDGWICQICGEPISSTTEIRSKVLSLDHIKSRACGGHDGPSNIRLAHFGCNASKKDRDDSYTIPGSFQESSTPEGKGREQGIPPTPCEGVGADSVEESPAFQEEEETAGEGPEEKLVLSEQDCASQNENPAAPPDLTKIRRAGRAEKKRRRVEVVTPLMARIGGMVPGRSADRRWTWQEYEALWDIQPLADADLALLERYYAADHPREQDYRRRQLMTLLNNWEAEVVKATRWAKENEGPGRPPGIRIL